MLLACIAAGMTASCILFVLYGPVPQKRKVTIVSRHSAPDVFTSQPLVAIRPSALLKHGESPPALPRARSARGTAPRERPSDDNLQTDRVPRVAVDTGAFIIDGQ